MMKKMVIKVLTKSVGVFRESFRCMYFVAMGSTVDFGHLHTVISGQYTTNAEVETVFDKVGET